MCFSSWRSCFNYSCHSLGELLLCIENSILLPHTHERRTTCHVAKNTLWHLSAGLLQIRDGPHKAQSTPECKIIPYLYLALTTLVYAAGKSVSSGGSTLRNMGQEQIVINSLPVSAFHSWQFFYTPGLWVWAGNMLRNKVSNRDLKICLTPPCLKVYFLRD